MTNPFDPILTDLHRANVERRTQQLLAVLRAEEAQWRAAFDAEVDRRAYELFPADRGKQELAKCFIHTDTNQPKESKS